MPNVVYRVYTDGRPPELVRGVDLIGTPLAAFGKIVAASDTVDVFNGMCGAESGSVPVSASSPSLLVSEVEVQKKAQSQETLPILAGAGAEAEVLTTHAFEACSLRRLCAALRRSRRLVASPATQSDESPLVAAMKDELARSMSELRIKDEPRAVLHRIHVDDGHHADGGTPRRASR